MQFLINTLDGETITVDLLDNDFCITYANTNDDVAYVGLKPHVCRLSTARSLEAEAVKEATGIMRRLTDGNNNIGWGTLEEMNEWLEKWGRD